MSDRAVPGSEPQAKESNWITTGRICLVIGIGEVAASILPSHTDWAYFGGLLLGFILELLIFPRLAWKRNLTLLLIILVAGLLRIALKSASP